MPDSSQQFELAESATTGKTAPSRLSISTNAAIGLIGVLVTLFGSAIISLMLHTLNNLGDRITAVEASLGGRITAVETSLNERMDAVEANLGGRITALSQQQAGMDKTLSVLIAILNARSEVEAAEAHQIAGAG